MPRTPTSCWWTTILPFATAWRYCWPPSAWRSAPRRGGRAEALARLKEHPFNLAIVDLSLNGEDGVTLVADLHQRSIPVLVYSTHNDATRVQGAFAAGALGYVTKQEFDGVLLQAIREVAAGRRFVSPEAAVALAEGLTALPAVDALQELSPHERKVYELIGRGSDTFDIAAALHVTNHTVESYYSRILVKLNLNGMHELRLHAIDYFQKHTG